MKKKKNSVNGGFRVIDNRDGAKFKFKNDVNLHILSDVHLGAPTCDIKLFKKAIEMIRKDKNAYCILNGDMLENIIPNYKISQRGQDFEPDEQFMKMVELLKPISHKILFSVMGNHSHRSINVAGLDIVMLMAKYLNHPYYPVGGFVKFNINKQEFLGAVSHGKSAAVNGDTELEKMRRLYSGADFYALSHNHQLYSKPVDGLEFTDKEHLKETWFIRTGSFLKLPLYARAASYAVVRTGWIEIKMKKDGSLDCVKHSRI
jgi:predicted phosphodiesterase